MLAGFNISEPAELAERRRIAHEVYMITGVLVPEDDILVLAALFFIAASCKTPHGTRQASLLVPALRAA